VEPIAEGTGRVRLKLGDYVVIAELDASKPSYLAAYDQAHTSAIVTGQAAEEISLGNEKRRARAKGSTLLWEKAPTAAEVFREETDQLPPILIFGNRY
jgi:hypothetical protein